MGRIGYKEIKHGTSGFILEDYRKSGDISFRIPSFGTLDKDIIVHKPFILDEPGQIYRLSINYMIRHKIRMYAYNDTSLYIDFDSSDEFRDVPNDILTIPYRKSEIQISNNFMVRHKGKNGKYVNFGDSLGDLSIQGTSVFKVYKAVWPEHSSRADLLEKIVKSYVFKTPAILVDASSSPLFYEDSKYFHIFDCAGDVQIYFNNRLYGMSTTNKERSLSFNLCKDMKLVFYRGTSIEKSICKKLKETLRNNEPNLFVSRYSYNLDTGEASEYNVSLLEIKKRLETDSIYIKMYIDRRD